MPEGHTKHAANECHCNMPVVCVLCVLQGAIVSKTVGFFAKPMEREKITQNTQIEKKNTNKKNQQQHRGHMHACININWARCVNKRIRQMQIPPLSFLVLVPFTFGIHSFAVETLC